MISAWTCRPFRGSARVGLALALVAGLLSGTAHQGRVLWAQEEETQLFIKVLDEDGMPVTDLSADDFLVRQGEVDGRVLRIELIDEPLRLALLIDDAAGANDYFPYLRDGLPGFVDALPDTSEVALVLLSGRVRVMVDYTDGLAKVKENVADFFVDQGSPAAFFDGLRETVDGLQGEARWPVMVMITTDGPSMAQNSFTERRYEQLIDQIAEHAVTVHALGLNVQNGDGFQTGIAGDLTEMTGGWYETVNSPSQSVTEKLAELAEEISRRQAEASNQYLVVFQPPAGVDPASPIQAGVKRAGVQLRIAQDGRPQ